MIRKIISLFLIAVFLSSPVQLFAESKWGQCKPPLGSKIDWSHPLAKGLVGCWLMNEGGGNQATDLVSNIKATPYTTSSFLWEVTQKGIAKKGIEGTAGGLNTNQKILLTNGYSLEAIVYPFADTSDSGIVGSWSTNGYMLYSIANNGGFRGFVNTTYTTYTVGTALNWWHLIATWDKSNIRLFANGVQVAGPTAATTITQSGQNTLISMYNNDITRDWEGYIVKVAIYNRALSPQEIQQLYIDPYCFIKQDYRLYYVPPAVGPTVTLSRIIHVW